MAGLSSSERETLEKAIGWLTHAVTLEKDMMGHPPDQILHLYCQGLKLLLSLLDSPRCLGQLRTTLLDKCRHYWARVRHFQALLTTIVQTGGNAGYSRAATSVTCGGGNGILGFDSGTFNSDSGAFSSNIGAFSCDNDVIGSDSDAFSSDSADVKKSRRRRRKSGKGSSTSNSSGAVNSSCAESVACEGSARSKKNCSNAGEAHNGAKSSNAAVCYENDAAAKKSFHDDDTVSYDSGDKVKNVNLAGCENCCERLGEVTDKDSVTTTRFESDVTVKVRNEATTDSDKEMQMSSSSKNGSVDVESQVDTTARPVSSVNLDGAASRPRSESADPGKDDTDGDENKIIGESSFVWDVEDLGEDKVTCLETTEDGWETYAVDLSCVGNSEDEGDEEDEFDKYLASFVRRALREAREVDLLAQQILSPEGGAEAPRQKMNPSQDNPGDEEEEDRHHSVRRVLDAIVQTNGGRGADCSWVKGPGVGLEDLEMALREQLVLPLTFPKIISGRYCPYLLLFGQPGDGVLPLLRYLRKAWGTYQTLTVSGASLMQAVAEADQGVTERELVQGLFNQALLLSPCAIFFTDFHLVAGSTYHLPESQAEVARRLKTEILVKMESLRHCREVIMFVAITSQPWLIDAPVRKRFGFRGFCQGPSPEERMAMLVAALRNTPHCLQAVELRRIAEKTSAFSRVDMRMLAEEAQAMLKLRVQQATHFKPLESTLSSQTPRHFTRNTSSLGRLHSQCHTQDREDGDQRASPDAREEEDLDPSSHKPSPSSEPSNNSMKTPEAAADDDSDTTRLSSRNYDTSSECACATMRNYTSDEEVTHRYGVCGIIHSSDDSSKVETVPAETAISALGPEDPEDTEAAISALEGPEVPENNEAVTSALLHPEDNKDTESACSAVVVLEDTAVMYIPCQPWEEGAVTMRWGDLGPGQCVEPELSYQDVVAAIHCMDCQGDQDNARRLRQWHEEWGTA